MVLWLQYNYVEMYSVHSKVKAVDVKRLIRTL